ncbi:serine hydrolase domain-containing protein [Halomonas denitrificans]|nr:beta-lactamase family protein [Halomonas denitrificans]
MRILHNTRVVFAFVCLSFAGSLAHAADLPDTPAAQRLNELIGLMANATPDRVADYVGRHYTDEYAGFLPIDRRIASFMDWHRRGGMQVVEVLESRPERIDVITKQAATGERWMLGVQVEAEEPHRVERMMVGRAPMPAIERPLSEREVAERWLAYVGELAERDLFSGAVLIAHDGTVLGQAAWGLANRDFDAPNTVHTRFNLGSMNKTWTAVAIGQLVEAGKLAFDDPLSKFIDYPSAEAASEIRIEHLLTHTSGLGSYFTEDYDRTARKTLRTVDDFLALSAGQAPAFEPGTDWQYSNTGMMVLGKVIEVVSGENYFDYIQHHVLDPAGMDRSGCFELDRVNDNLAVGYAERWSRDGAEVVNNVFDHVVRGGPAGGCYSTVGDLFRFANALTDGTLVSPAMAETLTTGKPEIGSPDYGYGFGIHPGRALYGHSGGFIGISANLDITVDPAGWVVVVLANTETSRAPTLKARQLIGVRESE